MLHVMILQLHQCMAWPSGCINACHGSPTASMHDMALQLHQCMTLLSSCINACHGSPADATPVWQPPVIDHAPLTKQVAW
jgi:hypothetical protein